MKLALGVCGVNYFTPQAAVLEAGFRLATRSLSSRAGLACSEHAVEYRLFLSYTTLRPHGYKPVGALGETVERWVAFP